MVAIDNETDGVVLDLEAETRPGVLLREVTRMYSRAQRVVADCCKTTNTQCHLLIELARSGPLSQTDLGTRVLLEKSWVSRAVEAMVDRGLVTKTPNPADARSWLVTLSDKGVRTVGELDRSLNAHAEQLLASLRESERDAVEAALVLLMKLLREDSAANCCLPAPQKKDPR